MKHLIFKIALRFLKRVSRLIQIGNPVGKAPILVEKPNIEEKIFSDNEMEVWQLKTAFCCIGFYNAAIISKNNELYSNFIAYPWGKDLHPALSIPYLGKPYLRLDNAVFLFTPEAKGNYYHWMIDLLPRLLFLKKTNTIELTKTNLIIHSKPKSYEDQTLLLLGIPLNKIIRVDPFKIISVENLIIPDYNDYGERFPEWKYELLKDFKNKILKKNTTNGSRQIYLLRGNQRIRRLIGEDLLTKILMQEGFEIINPQVLTLEEQIQTLSDAKIVIALHGAALTNIVFCNEGTKVIELRSDNQSPEYFKEIAKIVKLNFETVSLPPEKVFKKKHIANKANIILTIQGIKEIILKVKSINSHE